MLSQMSKLFVLRRTRRNLRPVMSSIRSRQFERLEYRSMLSANLGAGPDALGAYAFDNHGHDAPSHGNEEVYAPISQFAFVDGFMPRGDELHYAHLDSFNQFQPTYNSNIGDGPGAWNFGGQFGPLSSNVAMSAAASSNKPAVASAIASPTVIVVYVNKFEPYFENYPTSTPPSQSSMQTSIARATAPAAFANNPSQLIKSTQIAPKSPGDLYIPNSISAATNAAAIPSATQIIARYADKGSVVPNTALDTVLQSYSPHLLLVANTSATDRANLATTSENTVLSDNSFDDFIELADSSTRTAESALVNSRSSEYDAISEVLDHLQELDLTPWRTNALDAQAVKDAAHSSASQDTPLALALADFALANVEGGMVMLDVNDGQSGDIDFSNIAVSDAVSPASHLNFESAVGFYQVVEVAGEEAPGAIRTTSNVPAQSVSPNRTENRLSNQNRRATNGKATVVAGVSALIGAAVWCAQRKQSDDEASSTSALTRRC